MSLYFFTPKRPAHEAWYKETVEPHIGKLFRWKPVMFGTFLIPGTHAEIWHGEQAKHSCEVTSFLESLIVRQDDTLMLVGLRCFLDPRELYQYRTVGADGLAVSKDIYSLEFLCDDKVVGYPISPRWTMHNVFEYLEPVVVEETTP